MSTFSIFREFEDVVLRNPDFLHEHVASGIFETLELVSYGLESAESFDPSIFKIPGESGFTFWAGHDPDPESLPSRFGTG